MTTPSLPGASRTTPIAVAGGLLFVFALTAAAAVVAEPAKKRFDFPADSVEKSLKLLAEVSGVEVLYPTNFARNVRTNPVSGEFTTREALERMLAGTGLVAVQDQKTGALTIQKAAGTESSGKKAAARGESSPASRAANPSTRAAPAEEPVQLSVFEVAVQRDDSYGSATSTSITGTRKELRRMPVTAEVLGRAFLDDLAVLEIREQLEFAPGTGAFIIAGGSSDAQGNQAGDRIGAAVGSLRGLSVETRRNGFLSNGSSFDGFNKDRVEIIRGPQALLYGPTNASGIIVLNTKRPSFAKSTARLQVRTDSEGSRRGEIEVNATGRIPGSGQPVGLLVSGFDNHDKFWRVNNEIQSRAIYLAGAWKLTPRVTLRADYEKLRRHAVDPSTIRLSAPVTNPVYGSRNNRPLRLLLYQDQAGDVFDGRLNYANADSFGTDVNGELRTGEIFSGRIEAEIAPWLSLLAEGGFSNDDRIRFNAGGGSLLVPPGLGGNPTGAWGVQLTPVVDPIYSRERAYRSVAHIVPPDLGFLKNEISVGGETRWAGFRQLGERWFEIDANGEFVRNPGLINNTSSGRTLLGNLWWAPGTQGFDGPAIFRSPAPNVIEVDGKRYRRDATRNTFPQLVTPDNPQGFAGGSANINYNHRINDAVFAAISSSWFDERFDTLAGYRFDWLTTTLEPLPNGKRSFNVGSYMYGVNYHLTRNLTPYYAHSTSFQPSAGLTILNEPTPEGRGIGDEAGLKFNLGGDQLTGSISVFSSKAINNNANLPVEVLDVVNRVSAVNGRRNGGGVYVFDRVTKGFEINFTAAPIRGWRVQAGFSHIGAKEGADIVLPILYNDQFNTNAAGQVTFSDGRPVLVPVNPATVGWNPASPTPGVPAQPLTVAMLRNGDASGNYKASLDANSGLITNAGAVYLNTPGVGTGVTGLPISQHQLGFVPPTGNTYLARKGGDRTTGYASDSVSVTTNYSFSQGFLKGVGAGGNFRQQLNQAAYYYVDRQTNSAAPERKLFFAPDQTIVSLWASYEFRWRHRFVWRTQINVANALNRVSAIVFPNVVNGSPDNMRLNGAPRVWTWTNSIRF